MKLNHTKKLHSSSGHTVLQLQQTMIGKKKTDNMTSNENAFISTQKGLNVTQVLNFLLCHC